MTRSYKAVLRGDQLEWTGSKPEITRAIPVVVTLNDEAEPLDRAERGRRMAEALRTLAEGGAFSSIADPSGWEREVRGDRALPGRE